MTRRVGLFVEDFGHEAFIKALVERIARQYGIGVEIKPYSVRGGHGRALAELKEYVRDLERGRVNLPDLLIVARDANCKGYLERKQEIDRVTDKFKDLTICAIPDPHIQRWLLLDSAAFKAVLGKGCAAPDQKCNRDRYKELLLRSMRNAGISPPLGGMEYAEDIVNVMDLQRMERIDDSLGKLLKELHNKLKEWSPPKGVRMIRFKKPL
ncbi:MAG: hypothetical protein HY673_11875 [Chloroflexi bacterium]|nr:hypothetical protein [Chloroflexota bacterium]